jgi:hypothetical protein
MTSAGAQAQVGTGPPAPPQGGITPAILVPDGTFSPQQIDERGRILGELSSARGDEWCRYERGKLTPLLPRDRAGTYSTAIMNERGDVAGAETDQGEQPLPYRPFLWSRGRLVDLSAAGSAEVVAMSDRAHLLLQPRPVDPPPTGELDPRLRPAVWDNGRIIVSPAPPEGTVFEVGTMFDVGHQHAMNAGGLVTGRLRRIDNLSTQAAVWRPGGPIVALGGLGANGSWPFAVTSTGTVIGTSDDAAGISRVFVWRAGRGMTAIGLPNAESEHLGVEAFNDRGHIVVSDQSRRYLWRDGTFTEIGRAQEAIVWGMNDHDQVILERLGGPPAFPRLAYVWQAGTLSRLDDADPSAGGRDVLPLDINDQGHVVGASYGGEGQQALLWRIPPR